MGADISPYFFRVDGSRHGVSKLDIVVADGVAADDGAIRFFHLVEAAADDLLENRRVAFFGEAYDGKCRNRFSAHGVNIAERIGGRDLAEGEGIVDDRREKIYGLNKRKLLADQIHPGVVVGAEANEYVRISWQWQAP